VGSARTYSPRKKNIRDSADRCYYCGHLFKRSGEFCRTFDHVIPVAKGGRSTKDNLVVACRRCNNLKSDLTLYETVGRINDRLRFATDKKEIEELKVLRQCFLNAAKLRKSNKKGGRK